MIDLTRRPCLVCGGTPSEFLHQTTYPEFRFPGLFTMRRCNGCGLLFNSPRMDVSDLGKLYGANYYFFRRATANEFKRIVPTYWRTVGRLDAGRIPATRLMDIGCGRGYFPAVLRELGWDARGIEFSPDAAQFARRKFGLDVFAGTAEEYASVHGGQFPVVTAIDVIEHVPAPDEFIQAAAGLVKPGGQLVIDTPNAAAANIAIDGRFWKGFNPFHIFLFTVENLSSLLSRHGFVVGQSFSYNNGRATGFRSKMMGWMKQTGLSSIAARMYFGMRGACALLDNRISLGAEKAASEIRAKPPAKFPGDDGPFAATKTGDNFVLIASRL
ncbi:MAG: class I SAM-dependent methyltransferase [Limisphaerales bacterium]